MMLHVMVLYPVSDYGCIKLKEDELTEDDKNAALEPKAKANQAFQG